MILEKKMQPKFFITKKFKIQTFGSKYFYLPPKYVVVT